MIHLAIIAAVCLSAFIEGIRIEGVKGKVFNVKKWVSVLIGAALYLLILEIFGYTRWYFILPEMLFIRATLYDPVLNKLRGLKWTYISGSTNSLLDRLEAKIGLHFVAQRVLYSIISVLLILIYELW